MLGPTTWPDGSYALLSAVDGCPDGFTEGNYTHWSRGTVSNPTSSVLAGDYQRAYNTYTFCVLENNSNGGKWPKGSYCIMRKSGTCPEGECVLYKEYVPYSSETFRDSTLTKASTSPIECCPIRHVLVIDYTYNTPSCVKVCL